MSDDHERRRNETFVKLLVAGLVLIAAIMMFAIFAAMP